MASVEPDAQPAIRHPQNMPITAPAPTSEGKCNPRYTRLQAMRPAARKVGTAHRIRRVANAVAAAKANATLACLLGNPFDAACGSHCLPRPMLKGRSMERKCCPRLANSQAVAMASRTCTAPDLTWRSPTRSAPASPPAINSGSCWVAKKAQYVCHWGDETEPLTYKNRT